MPVIKLNSKHTFEANTGTSILEAGINAGLSLPYSCKTGRCSACRCKISQGETQVQHEEVGLTDAEKKEGWILSCARTAVTDINVDVEELLDVRPPDAKTLPCRISSIENVSSDILRVILRLPPTAEFEYIAGQYISVIGPNGVRRSYSLANAGSTENHLELHIRKVNGGAMSQYWFNHAKVNDLLRLHGPLGTFFLHNIEGMNLVFIATGTGIAPIKAMLESLHYTPTSLNPKSVTVYWGGRVPGDLYIDIRNIPGNHVFIPVLSRAELNWPGARGYVQDALLKSNLDMGNTVVYACGSDIMIASAKKELTNMGLPLNKFRSDAFVTSS